MSDNKMLACTQWEFQDVICGHADPMNFATDIDLDAEAFRRLDRIELLAVNGLSTPCE